MIALNFIAGCVYSTGVKQSAARLSEAPADKDVRIGGGPDAIRQYLCEGLIDELHIAVSPVLLERGIATEDKVRVSSRLALMVTIK